MAPHEHTLEPSLFTTFLLSTCLLWFIYKYIKHRASLAGLPPGPRGYPLLGVAPLLGKNQFAAFTRWAEEFGDVISVPVIGRRLIVLNDADVIRETMSQAAFAARPRNYRRDMLTKNCGKLIHSNLYSCCSEKCFHIFFQISRKVS